MIEFIGGTVVLICIIGGGIWLWKALKNSNNSVINSFNSLNENDLVKKFNSLCDSLANSNKRSIDNIAKEMLEVLKEYKCRKIEQFVESEQLLNKNKRHLEEEIAKIDKQIIRLNSDAKALIKPDMTDEDYEIGAMYMAQIDDTEKLKQDLIQTSKENQKQIDKVDKQIKSFNAKYTIKEGSITNMIIKAKTHKNFSNVDLKLNDLISEFNDKVQDVEIENHVRSQINNNENEEDTNLTFTTNKEEYIAKFKNLVNNNK